MVSIRNGEETKSKAVKSDTDVVNYIQTKPEFIDFINNAIKGWPGVVVGVKAKGTKFVFDKIESASELRLDYDVTLQSPRKFFLPETETLMHYSIGKGLSVKPVCDAVPRVIIGVHPYDIIAISQMDRFFGDKNIDDNYQKRRAISVIVGLNMQSVSKRSFAASMGTATVKEGYDLMLTDIGDRILIEVGSDKGMTFLKKYAKYSPASESDIEKADSAKNAILKKFKCGLSFPPTDLPKLLEGNYSNPIWAFKSGKCLKCGTCNLVCPTCYCFDVKDSNRIGLKEGQRIRTWDGCLLEDFAVIGSGENFREDIATRYRHRFYRKGKYVPEKYGFIACVGCGRCSQSCLPDIADPVNTYNTLKEAGK